MKKSMWHLVTASLALPLVRERGDGENGRCRVVTVTRAV